MTTEPTPVETRRAIDDAIINLLRCTAALDRDPERECSRLSAEVLAVLPGSAAEIGSVGSMGTAEDGHAG